MKIKNKKTEYKPYKKLNDKNVNIMFDYQPVKKMVNGEEKETPLAIWEEHRFNHIPTEEEIQKVVLDYYNKKIDNEILSGLVWKGMNIWLSSENQFNYKAAYDLAVQTNGATLPMVFKFGDDKNVVYYEFKTVEELSDFYMASINHIQTTLQKGWDVKDNINWPIFQ